MITLDMIIDIDALNQRVESGHVKITKHPYAPLSIANYTAACQYERAWDDVTRSCRGLIWNHDTMAVVARPWAKFYNHGEHPEGSLDVMAPCEVTDKMDGSLGIIYESGATCQWSMTPYSVATRGSFTSDQAQAASEMLGTMIRARGWKPEPGITYLCEIIYPENRIIVDYGDLRTLILLGGVHIDTGKVISVDTLDWPASKVDRFTAASLGEALALPTRENAEGVIVRMLHDDTMVKIKQEDYVALHKMVFGLNERVIWEKMVEGTTVRDLCVDLPDEFHAWVKDVFWRIAGAAKEVADSAEDAFEHVMSQMPDDFTRKDFAEIAVQQQPHTPFLFLMLDKRDIWPEVWKRVKPSGANKFKVVSEDVA